MRRSASFPSLPRYPILKLRPNRTRRRVRQETHRHLAKDIFKFFCGIRLKGGM